MWKRRFGATAVACCVLALLGCAAAAPAQPGDAQPTTPSPGSPDAAAEVEAFFREGIAAFNRHDLDDFLLQFAPDIQMYTPTGWLRGREQVRERFAGTFADFPNVRMELEDLRARQVAPGVVTTDFRWRVFPMGQGPAFHGVGSGVYVRREGRWQEVLEHETVTSVDEALRSPGSSPP